jgi:hypothetical protein
MPPVTLREDVVLAAARQRTGLDDFGADDFRARLRVWLAAADRIRRSGRSAGSPVFRNAVRYLVNRLRLEDLLRRHPEIRDVRLRAPIIVAGLRDPGTTHLVNLIAADARLRSSAPRCRTGRASSPFRSPAKGRAATVAIRGTCGASSSTSRPPRGCRS